MAWTYEQSSGRLLHNGVVVATGYSGNGPGLNNPNMQMVPDHGPIPRGSYSIGPQRNRRGNVGVMNLTPKPGTNVGPRFGFLIHGDNAAASHTASNGCIILPPHIRQLISASPDKELVVVQ